MYVFSASTHSASLEHRLLPREGQQMKGGAVNPGEALLDPALFKMPLSPQIIVQSSRSLPMMIGIR